MGQIIGTGPGLQLVPEGWQKNQEKLQERKGLIC